MLDTVIFDMDGVISDTQSLHATAESQLLAQCGVSVSAQEITERFAGTPCREMFRTLLAHRDNPGSLAEDLAQQKWAMLNTARIVAIPGALSLISRLSGVYRLGLASSSSIHFVHHVLDELGIRSKFEAITGVEEVIKGKPDPEIFLLTAQKLEALPCKCLVIEDSLHGMTAAKRAGMKCIGLIETGSARPYPADVLVESLEQISDEMLKILGGRNGHCEKGAIL